MKKVVIVTLLMLSITALVNAQSMCVKTGNVEAKIVDTSNIQIINGNDYMVSVDWSLYGVKEGKQVFLNSGSTYVGSKDSEVVNTHVTSSEAYKYDRLSVRITPAKCD